MKTTKLVKDVLAGDRMVRAAQLINQAIDANVIFTEHQWKQFGDVVLNDTRFEAFMKTLVKASRRRNEVDLCGWIK